MSRTILTVGAPASGKTSWAKEYLDLFNKGRVSTVNVCRDDLRSMLTMNSSSAPRGAVVEDIVSRIQFMVAQYCAEHDLDVVVSDTNLNHRFFADWVKRTRELGTVLDVKSFVDVPVEDCVQRDSWRPLPRMVGEKVIRRMLRNFERGGGMEEYLRLASTEGADAPSRRYSPDESKPSAFILDVDGTIAHSHGRSPYDFSRVHEDSVDSVVLELVRILQQHYHVVVLSGRDDSCRPETSKWLEDAGVHFSDLHMRRTGDHRRDSVVKEEVFFEEVAPYFNVRFCLDDRKQVVDMWRRIGVKCLDVAGNTF